MDAKNKDSGGAQFINFSHPCQGLPFTHPRFFPMLFGMKQRIKPWQDGDSAPKDLLQQIRARRPGGKLLDLDRALLKSIPLAEGWNQYLKRIRADLSLPGLLRELIICRIAQLNGADYEWTQHAPIFLKEGGTQAQLDELKTGKPLTHFSETEKAVIALTDESTRQIQVSDATFDHAKGLLGETQTVEAVAVISCYNMVSRFLVALHVGH